MDLSQLHAASGPHGSLLSRPPSLRKDEDLYDLPWGFTIRSSSLHYVLNSFPDLSYFRSLIAIKCFDRQGDIGFFLADDHGNGINILSFSRKRVLASIDVSKPRLCFSVPNNQLAIVSRDGTLAYWDISNICQPKKISHIQLISEQYYLNKVLKINDKLVFVLHNMLYLIKPKSRPLCVYDLNKNTSNTFFLHPKSSFVAAGQEVIIELNPHFIRACEIDEQGLTELWKKEFEERAYYSIPPVSPADIGFLYPKEDIDPHHPYLYYKQKIENQVFYTILSALNGKELIKIQRGLRSDGFEKLIGNAFFIFTANEIKLWLLPSGTPYTIIKDEKLEGYNFENIAWDGKTLVKQFSKKHPELDRFEVIFLVYDHPQKPAQMNQKIETPINLSPMPRSYFLKVMASGLCKTIPWTIFYTLTKIMQVVTLFHFWLPYFYQTKFTWKSRFLDAGISLLQIVSLPLLVVGQQMAALWGVISPAQGDRLLQFLDKQITHLDIKTITSLLPMRL